MELNGLLYGAAYCDAHISASRAEEDMSLMKKAGFNLIRVGESAWSTWESKDGEFDFRNLHRVLAAAQKHGISVIVGIPVNVIPPWLAKKYPDTLLCADNGSGWIADITNADYLHHCERLIRKLMEQCLLYDNIIGYQLADVARADSISSRQVYAMFREYLQQKFETVEELNKAFGFAYGGYCLSEWDELDHITVSGSFSAEFETFRRKLVTDYLTWQSGIVSEYLHDGQVVTNNFGLARRDHSCGLQPDVDQFKAAAAVSIAGVDIDSPAGLRDTGAEISFGGDLGRSLKNGNYLVLRTPCQGTLGDLPYPGQLRLHAFHHLACGANGVAYRNWHSSRDCYDSFCKGVLSHDLKPGRSYRECSTVGTDFARIGEKLVGLKKKSKVAILVSWKSLCGFKSGCKLEYNECLRWIYDASFRLNIEVDLIADTQRDFSRYDLLMIPGLYSASEDLIAAIRHYVSGGGRLIATFRSFFADEDLVIRQAAQPYGMTDVFGMTYDEFTIPEKTRLKGVSGAVEDWMELLRPDKDTEVLAGYDSPAWPGCAAVTRSSFGKGSAVYIGCYAPDSMEELLKKLLSDWHLEMPGISWPIVVKQGVNRQGKKIIYLLNYSNDTREIHAPATGVELLTGNPVREGEPISLLPWDVRILEGES